MSEAGHLSVLAPLEGRWVGKGDGFSSTLVYEWVLPSVLLRARNEVRSDAGALIAQYEGHYVRDPAESRIVFWTVGRNGELHRGTVVPREGPLWHEATVAGGRVNGYRSVVSLVGPELHYRAQYDSSASDAAVLARAPLIYRRAQQERHARHEDNDHVLAAAMAVMRAREARDGAGLEALLSPEFVLRMPGDDDLGRQQCVDAVRAIPGEIVSVRGQKMKAARIGEIGVATGIQVATVRIDGTTIESRTAFADLFQKADDG